MELSYVKSTLVGRIAWLPRRTIGTFITFEFGSPILDTREPILRANVHPHLTRRRVTVRGEQHLWIQADDWTLQSESWKLLSTDDPLCISQRLESLAGQRLIDIDATSNGSAFRFEYGEALIVQPDPDPMQTQWSVFWHTGGNASWLSGGNLKQQTSNLPD